MPYRGSKIKKKHKEQTVVGNLGKLFMYIVLINQEPSFFSQFYVYSIKVNTSVHSVHLEVIQQTKSAVDYRNWIRYDFTCKKLVFCSIHIEMPNSNLLLMRGISGLTLFRLIINLTKVFAHKKIH